jgi:hypothetical protein
MSVWGEQWQCPSCKWENVFIRKKCRHCGTTNPNKAPTEPKREPCKVIDLGQKRAEREARVGGGIGFR